MPTFVERIQSDLKDAMKNRDEVRLTTLRELKTALTNAAIQKGGLGTPLTDAEAFAVVNKQVKQRQDSAEQFEGAGRAELAAKEREEMTILEGYLPTPLSEEEIAALVETAIAETGATGKADMGKVMQLLKERVQGRADGKTLSREVAQRLA